MMLCDKLFFNNVNNNNIYSNMKNTVMVIYEEYIIDHPRCHLSN